MTKTAEMADVVLPGTASWCEAEGTVTNSERRVQRVRKALDPPGEARDDTWIIAELARRLGHDWGHPTAEEIWDECRSLSPMHRGMRLRPARRAARAPVAVPGRGASGIALPPRPPVGRSRRGAARAVQRRRGEAAVRGARRRLPDPAHDRAPPRVVQHGRAVEPLPLAAPPRRVARPLARGRRAARDLGRRGRPRLVAARLGRRARADRPVTAGRARVHDVPLPRRGRRQPADDRRDRPEVRHGGVQGGRDPSSRRSPTRRGRGPPTRGRQPGPDGPEARSPCRADAGRASRARRGPRRPRLRAGRAAHGCSGADGNTAAGGHAARARRHLLLPALWALQERIGWISPGGLNEICRRLTSRRRTPTASRRSTRSSRSSRALRGSSTSATTSPAAATARRTSSRRSRSASAPRATSRTTAPRRGTAAPASASATGRPPRWSRSPRTSRSSAPRRRSRQTPCSGCSPAVSPPRHRRRRFRRRATRRLRLLRRVGVADPASIDDYRAHGGYAALRRAFELGPEGVLREVSESKLVGRGGAAFPTGVKWEAVARQPVRPHYLDLQRGRVRARHLQGPGAARGRPVRGDRGDDDRRVRDRAVVAATSTSAASTRRRGMRSSTRSRRRATVGSSATT